MPVNIPKLIEANTKRWNAAKINPKLLPVIDSVAKRLVAAKARYLALQKTTGVPWYIIAVIHERESGQNWARSLAQGDPWNRKSTHDPRGRGPFNSFEEAAVDALVNCHPYAAKWHDWSIGGSLTLLQEYNGLGDEMKGKPSPYIWAGTNQYVKGKFVADHVYDPEAVDKQIGCAALLLRMKQLDASILSPSKGGLIAATVAIGTTATVGTAHSAGFVHYIPYILVGIAVAVIIGVAVHYYNKRKAKHVK